MLCELRTDDAILERLGRLPEKLEELYHELLQKMRGYKATADQQYAKKALVWLLYARRNMKSAKFLVAISAPSSSSVNQNQVLELCCNLVTFDANTETFRFAHLSVREFLEKQPEYNLTTSNALIAEVSLGSLIAQAGTEQANEMVLYPYASLFWATHCDAAGSERRHGKLWELLTTLFSRPDERQSPYSFWSVQVKTLVRNMYDNWDVRKRLEDCQSRSPAIVASAFNLSEWIEHLLGAAKSERETGTDCMTVAARHGNCEALLQLIRMNVSLSPETMLAAAGNYRSGKEVITLLLDRRGAQITITEEVVQAAAGNYSGKEVMTLLLDRRGDQITITEEVVKAAAGNYRSSKEVMALLLDRRGDQITITEKVVQAAAGNYSGKEVMALLLDRRGDQITITEEVVKAAAGNGGNGKKVMALLLDQRGETKPFITKTICDIAAACGQEKMLRFLFRDNNLITIYDEQLAIAQLYNAAWGGSVQKAEQLLHNGTPPDTKNIWGETPLWTASAYGHKAFVKMLINAANVNINAKSSRKSSLYEWPSCEPEDTVITVARRNGHDEIVKMLEQYLVIICVAGK